MLRVRALGSVLFVVGTAAGVAVAGSQARVKGVVVDGDGRPVAGATITLTSDELASFEKQETTDDKGGFKVMILDATKTYRFVIEAEGFLTAERTIKVGVGTMDNEETFTLTTEAEIAAAQVEELRQQPGYKELDAALTALQAGDTETGRAQLAAAVAAKPDLVTAWEALAEVDFTEGRMDTAMDSAEKCLELDDEAVGCLAVAANVARERGDEAQADDYLSRYREVNPDDPATLYNDAVEFLNALDDGSAKPLLEECLDLDPDFPKCLYEYGLLLLRAGDMDHAKEQFEHYLDVAPDGADAATVRETVKYL